MHAGQVLVQLSELLRAEIVPVLGAGSPSWLPELAVGVAAGRSVEQSVKGLHVGSIKLRAVDCRLLVQVHGVDRLERVGVWLLPLLAHAVRLELIRHIASNLAQGVDFGRCGPLFSFVILAVEAQIIVV